MGCLTDSPSAMHGMSGLMTFWRYVFMSAVWVRATEGNWYSGHRMQYFVGTRGGPMRVVQ